MHNVFTSHSSPKCSPNLFCGVSCLPETGFHVAFGLLQERKHGGITLHRRKSLGSQKCKYGSKLEIFFFMNFYLGRASNYLKHLEIWYFSKGNFIASSLPIVCFLFYVVLWLYSFVILTSLNMHLKLLFSLFP